MCERELGRGAGGGGRGRAVNLKQAPHSARSPTQVSVPRRWDHVLSQNQELGAQWTEPPRCPGLHSFIIWTDVTNILPALLENVLKLYLYNLSYIYIILAVELLLQMMHTLKSGFILDCQISLW